MQETLERFAAEVRRKRKNMHLTQRQLADKLRMHQRTIIDIENCNTIPGFDTVIYIAKELDISLDPILFPNTVSDGISKSVTDFFRNKHDTADPQKGLRQAQKCNIPFFFSGYPEKPADSRRVYFGSHILSFLKRAQDTPNTAFQAMQ